MPPTPRAQKPDESAAGTSPEQTPDPAFAALEERVAAAEAKAQHAEDQADAAYAQNKATAEAAGELLGDLSARVAALEAAPEADPVAGDPSFDAALAERVSKLERHVTVPLEVKVAPARELCDDCGAPLDGMHFDDCQYLPDPKPKGPRETQARVQQAAA